MAIRMSSLQYMYNYKVALNKAYQNQTKLFEQADGSKIHRGSDDPVAYSKLLRYNVSQAENERYQSDVENAVSFMKTADATLSNMADMAKTFVTKTIEAAVETNTSADFESIAREMYSCIEEIVSQSNSQQGDRYIFSGQKDITEPFTLSTELYDRSMSKTLDAAQTKFFKGQVSQGDSYVYQMIALEKIDKNADGSTTKHSYYLDTESGYVYTKEFVEEGYKELVTLDYSKVSDAQDITTETSTYQTVKELLHEGTLGKVDLNPETAGTDAFVISSYINEKGVVQLDSDTNPLTLNVTVLDSDGNVANATTTDDDGNEVTTTDTATATLDFTTIKQQLVTYSGDMNTISMVKRNGANDKASDSVNVMGQDLYTNDIFDDEKSGNISSGSAYLNDMLTVYNKVLSGDVEWLISDGVSLANASHNALTLSQTKIGSRIQLYENVSDMLTTQGNTITEDITNVSGTDVAELATRLMEMTALYNMSLSIGGRILPVSLADYL